MEGIRVKSKNIFKLIVNDEGEYIEIDINDVSNNFKCYEAIDKINKIQEEVNEKISKITSQLLEENPDECDTPAKREFAKIQHEAFIEIRKAIDGFLGKNACQKIFGDYNDFDMFDLLMEELEKPRKELQGKSYLDKMKIKAENTKEKLMEKYQKNKKAVI